ncbi:MAG: leucyl aminopeptidase [Desulfosalsimonadaceae bacterium]
MLEITSTDVAELPAELLLIIVAEDELLYGGAAVRSLSAAAEPYKEKKDKQPVKKVVLAADAETAEACSRIPARVEAVCKGTLLAREWVNIPPNDKRPDRFARSITKAADKEALKVTVLDEQEFKKNRMGGIVATGAGSKSRSRMVILDYSPKKPKKTCVLVGKGVTFDSGGINIKTGPTLEDMKMDMAGGASVAAALIAAARLKPDFRVVGVIPVVENMPSGDAVRPGDIIRSFAGKTVEIGNTDAEGRLILIDALAYAEKMFQPDVMMDIATLTGACIMALGGNIAGVFANDQKLSDAVVSAGESVWERCWPMPMPEDYRELLKSDFADIRNIGSSRWGGAIAAALFLSEFVADTAWAHIDIAGSAYAKKASDYCGAGGTGFGVRLLIEAMERL